MKLVTYSCHEIGLLITVCPVLKKKNQSLKRLTPKSVGFVCTSSSDKLDSNIDMVYDPFILKDWSHSLAINRTI